ncbi:MAG: hypothetical protein GOV02_02605 [Candidatus Aenigmarchaeota archaeon]|nr:hypothetical protein [Candidatus Aenigmarchaeota archaeon]
MAIYYVEDENTDPVPFHLKGDFDEDALSQMGYTIVGRKDPDIYVTKTTVGNLMDYKNLIKD